MNTNPLNKGVLSENFTGIGAVTREMVQARALELAIINGRTPPTASSDDWEQAKRELTGESDADPRQALFEAIPESDRWNPVPGTIGHKTPESASEDEDDDGRSECEQLVDQGVAEAEHDQMLQAAKDTAQKNP